MAELRGARYSTLVYPRTEFAVDLPTVLGDKIQLQQVILNLVVNAIEAMSGVTENFSVRAAMYPTLMESRGAALAARLHQGIHQSQQSYASSAPGLSAANFPKCVSRGLCGSVKFCFKTFLETRRAAAC
jgi:hypothetical protein